MEGSSLTATPAFADLEQYRRELTAYCYRMLGSPFEAEDAVQDALLRAWRSLDRFEGRAALRSWLYRIATNVCLDMLNGRQRRARPMDLGPARSPDGPIGDILPETTWIEPVPDGLVVSDGDPADVAESRETIRLAFVAALQHLPPRQRAVLILREVLGFSAKEVAAMLDTTPASVNSAMQRARVSVDERLPERSQQETLRALDDDEIRSLVERYIEAWDRGDVDAVVSMLAEEATFSMPPNAQWFRGREAIREFLPTGPLSIPRRFVATRANGQLAFGTYKLIDGEWIANAIHVITLDPAGSGEIADAVAFLDASLFARFGLPLTPPPA
jgi:RNA polymerase sigma-70 factor (ECF subfamily)